MVPISRIPSLTFKALLFLTLGCSQNALAQNHTTVEATFPGLAAGILKSAYLSPLPSGTLLTVDKVTSKAAELAKTISRASAPLQAKLQLV